MNSNWVRLLSTEGPAFDATAILYLKVRLVGVQQQAPGQPLKLLVEWAEGEKFTPPAEGQTGHWVELAAAITSVQWDAERFREVRIPLSSYPPIKPPFEQAGRTVDTWEWMLTARDAERVDAYRRKTNPRGPLYFNLTVQGQVQVAKEVHPVRSYEQISVEVSEWERYLGWIGYMSPPTITESVSGMVTDAPSWKKAEERLAQARRLLRAGDTRPALEAVLNELEAICGTPYKDSAWESLLVDAGVDKQKAEAVGRWLGGFGTYINSVGHHRQPQPDPNEAVADQWEAETALTSAQLLMTIAFRAGLDTRKPQAQRAVAVSSAASASGSKP